MEIAEVVAILVPQTGKNGKIRPNGEVERPPDRVNFTFAREFYFDPAVFPTTALRHDPCLHKEVAALHPFHTANFPPDLSPISQSPSIPAHHLATRPLVQLVFRVPLHSGVLEILISRFSLDPAKSNVPWKASASSSDRNETFYPFVIPPLTRILFYLSFFFFFAVEKRMEREERIIVIDISFRRNEDGETKWRKEEEGRSYDTRAGLPRCLFILANSTRISGITGKLACHPDNIPRITCTPFRWQKKKKKKKHSRQQRRRKFPANFSARESIDRESKNRVTRSREVRTSSALPRAGLASWIDRRRGSIGEGREARAYGRVVPVWACKKH